MPGNHLEARRYECRSLPRTTQSMKLPGSLTRSTLLRTLTAASLSTLPDLANGPQAASASEAAGGSNKWRAGYSRDAAPSRRHGSSVDIGMGAGTADAPVTTATQQYGYSVRASDQLKAFTPFPGWLCELLVSDRSYTQPAAAYNVSRSMVSSAPRGIIIMAHGLAGTRLDHAAVAESLAQRGFLVAAPDFADSYLKIQGRSGFSKEYIEVGAYTITHGLAFRDNALQPRVQTLETVANSLRSSYPDTPLGLFGFSLGGDSISEYSSKLTAEVGASKNWVDAAPKLYVCSPITDPNFVPPKPVSTGPTLQILGVGGEQYDGGDTFVPNAMSLGSLKGSDQTVLIDYLGSDNAGGGAGVETGGGVFQQARASPSSTPTVAAGIPVVAATDDTACVEDLRGSLVCTPPIPQLPPQRRGFSRTAMADSPPRSGTVLTAIPSDHTTALLMNAGHQMLSGAAVEFKLVTQVRCLRAYVCAISLLAQT